MTTVIFMAKKIDRRVRYTKMMLKSSIAELLNEKPLEKITVKEICEKADINRGTFYSHYSDQYDLYNSIVDELLDGIFDRLGDFMTNDGDVLVDSITNVYDYLKDNAETIRTLLRNGVEYSIENRIRNVIKSIYLEKINKSVDIDLINAAYSYMAAGAISLIRYWLNSNMNKSSREMAEFSLQLTSNGLSSLL